MAREAREPLSFTFFYKAHIFLYGLWLVTLLNFSFFPNALAIGEEIKKRTFFLDSRGMALLEVRAKFLLVHCLSSLKVEERLLKNPIADQQVQTGIHSSTFKKRRIKVFLAPAESALSTSPVGRPKKLIFCWEPH